MKVVAAAVVVSALLAVTQRSALSQSAQGHNEEVVRVETNLVILPVSVTDRDGKYVAKLRQEDISGTMRTLVAKQLHRSGLQLLQPMVNTYRIGTHLHHIAAEHIHLALNVLDALPYLHDLRQSAFLDRLRFHRSTLRLFF